MPRVLRLLSFCLALLVPVLAGAQQKLTTFTTGQLTIESGGKSHVFKIELALNQEQQEQGLMYRRTMAADAGMLFLYDAPRDITMWMKNTLLPLDMLFVAADGTITRIVERAVPQSLTTIPSGGPAKAVIELNGGTAARLGLKPGDHVHAEGLGG